MIGFDTGHKDENGKAYIVGATVEWIDDETFPCSAKIVLIDGCKIGVETHEGFVFACDLKDGGYIVSEDEFK
ncbi:hypothetical protein MKY95_19010 [Paenibacillus sp. FSL P4-0176]|uniref:hypothetical protein n=1 Tax=Paenibacillus sp. FSL P4-0176 TaxID=2921631 RepID=UPI0030CB7ED2